MNLLITLFCVCFYKQLGGAETRGQLKVGAARIERPSMKDLDLRMESLTGITLDDYLPIGETVAGFVNIDGNQNGQVVGLSNVLKDLGIPAEHHL